MTWICPPEPLLPARRLGALLGVLSVASLARDSLAERATESVPFARLSYDVPTRCPDRAAFEEKVRARTGAATELALSVRIADESTRFVGRLVVGTAVREIAAPDCDEVVDGLALVAALALEQQEDHQDRHDGATPGAGEGAPADAAPGERVPPDSPGAIAARSDAADRTPAVQEPATKAPRQRSLSLVAMGLAVSGVAPDVRPGASIGVQWASGVGAASEVSLRGAFLMVLPETVDTVDGRARFAFWTATFGACARRTFAAGDGAIGACAVFEQGMISAAGSDTLRPASTRRNWSAPGLSLETEWVLARPALVVAGLEGVVPLTRDNFLLGDTVAHRVPSIALRAGVGLGVRVW